MKAEQSEAALLQPTDQQELRLLLGIDMVACEVMQEQLVKQQQALQDQLQKALQLHLTPKTSVDTATVADKIISMFDDMIQV